MKRYRIIGLLVVLYGYIVPAIAQVQLMPGVVGGLSYYDESQSVNGAPAATGGIVGGVVGGILEIPLSENCFLRSGLMYSVRGGALGQGALQGGPTFTESDYLGYLAVPLDIKLSYVASPGFVPYGLLGFNLGILLSATGSVENAVPASGNVDAGINYNPLDFGLDAGLGAEFPGSDVIPFFEVEAYFGFENIYSSQSGYSQSGYSATNTGVEFRVGLKFKPEVIARIF